MVPSNTMARRLPTCSPVAISNRAAPRGVNDRLTIEVFLLSNPGRASATSLPLRSGVLSSVSLALVASPCLPVMG